jgi:DNA-directed RNA polymerase specialized sigma subunit
MAEMMMLMVHKYSNKGNWRYYTWLEDMRSHAVMTLCEKWAKFDESKAGEYPNPFAYFTSIISNAFKSYKIEEDKQRNAKDAICERIGITPSFHRQEHNAAAAKLRDKLDHEPTEDEIKDAMKLPEIDFKKINNQAKATLRRRLGREPTQAEFLEFLGAPVTASTTALGFTDLAEAAPAEPDEDE